MSKLGNIRCDIRHLGWFLDQNMKHRNVLKINLAPVIKFVLSPISMKQYKPLASANWTRLKVQ